MNYPKFIKNGSLIGVTAPSCGIREEKREAFEKSLAFIRSKGYRVTLTDNVFKSAGIASSPADVRVREILSLVENPDVDVIWTATGGDMAIQILDHMDYERIAKSPKWFTGYSDITNVLFPITLLCDLATVYGPNAGAFDSTVPHPLNTSVFDILGGKPPVLHSSEMYERERIKGLDGLNLDSRTEWVAPNGDFTASGRMLSTCIDCAMMLIGTKYAPVDRFIEKYKADGIIWNFDNFALTSEILYFALWHMKQAGWFKNTRAVMISRTRYPGSLYDYTYVEAAREALGDVPLVLETDTGHVQPQFPLVNGAMAKLTVKDGAGSVAQTLC